MGDAFCNGTHFADVNTALSSLNLPEIDWLPVKVGRVDSCVNCDKVDSCDNAMLTAPPSHTQFIQHVAIRAGNKR
jgi:hypothetical protein